MDAHQIRQLALAQHGLVTRSQVLDAGGSDRTVHRLMASGDWARLRNGVYVVGAAPPTWHQTAMGAILAAGPDAYLGSRSAARALGLVERVGPGAARHRRSAPGALGRCGGAPPRRPD